MISGGFDWTGVAGAGIGALGGLLGGLFEDEQPPPGTTMLTENKNLLQALMRARIGNKLKLPTAPNLPQFGVNPTPDLSRALATAKMGG